jgi:pimeloyl-ACP methyl ester carboxylesterase
LNRFRRGTPGCGCDKRSFGDPIVQSPRFVDTPTACFRVVEQEEGVGGGFDVPVVFATDPPNVLEHYTGLLEAWKGKARVVVVELPGFGQSRFRRGHRVGLQEQAIAVRDLLSVMDARPAILVFPCLSGFVALRIAMEDPEAVAGLVLPQVAGWEDTLRWIDRVDRRRLLRTPGLGQVINRLLRGTIARGWYAVALADPGGRPRFVGTALASFRQGARFPLATALQRFPADPPRGEVHQPVLAVWGQKDRSHRPTDPEGLRKTLPALQLHKWSTCGHFPELEDPEAFARLMRDWVGCQDEAGRRP